MNDLSGIKAINEGNAIRRRALAYAANHPGVSVADATARLVKQDAKNAKVRLK